MVTILTAFLGLVVGVHAVELSVEGDIASVEVMLGDKTVATVVGEPWAVDVDFGTELVPHALVAIARDTEGREIWRTERRINQPQARSQIELVLRSAADGDAADRAGIVWRSVDAEYPDAWHVTLDGALVDLDDPADFQLPPFDPNTPHVLQAVLRFGKSAARAELVFSGSATDSTHTDLTALVFQFGRGDFGRDKVPTAGEMEGWFSRNGRSIEVVAVEVGGADIITVHEATPASWTKLRKLRRKTLETSDHNPIKRRLFSGLHHEDKLRVVLPISEGGANEVTQFHMSTDFANVEYGPTASGATRQEVAGSRAHGFLATFPYPEQGPLSDEAPRQTADAVAVAAQVAAAANRARAVVLIREDGTEDHSRFEAGSVRRYLDQLQVPLFVWSAGSPGEDEAWGQVEAIASSEKFLRASKGLREAIDRQVVVWIRGRHLPHEIELSPTAKGRLRPVGSSS